jgi:hypothetical protein
MRGNGHFWDHEDFKFEIVVEFTLGDGLYERIAAVSGELPWGRESPVSVGSYTPRHSWVRDEEASRVLLYDSPVSQQQETLR